MSETPENVVALNLPPRKSWNQKLIEATHEFLVEHLRRITRGRNICEVCNGRKWYPHTKYFLFSMSMISAIIHNPLFYTIICEDCQRAKAFLIDPGLYKKYSDFKAEFIKKHGTKEEFERSLGII